MKEYLKVRLILIKASIINTFQRDFAYPFNNWGNIISSTIYTFITLLFINVLYSNVKTIAGFNRDEMILFELVGQFVFILTWMFSIRNIQDMIVEVNSGEIDLVLTKPLPALFYISSKTIDIFSIARDYSIGIIVLIYTINWASLGIEFQNLIIGAIILILGLIISHCIHFLSALPVFWIGESDGILGLAISMDFEFVQQIPFEGFNFGKTFQILLLSVLPFLISAGVSTSVILGKLPGLPFLVLAIIVCLVFLKIKSLAWKLALRSYTSASS